MLFNYYGMSVKKICFVIGSLSCNWSFFICKLYLFYVAFGVLTPSLEQERKEILNALFHRVLRLSQSSSKKENIS